MLKGRVIVVVAWSFMDNSMLRVKKSDIKIIPIVPALFFCFLWGFVL